MLQKSSSKSSIYIGFNSLCDCRNSLGSEKVVVVLSAMSSNIKSEGTTSRLLEAVFEVLTPYSTKYLGIIDLIEEAHLIALKQSISDNKDIYNATSEKIKAECLTLKSFLGNRL